MNLVLFKVCFVAFLSVMVLLSLLAGVIAVLSRLFPGPRDDRDEAVIAAIHAAVTALLPGSAVTSIKEEK